jgi:ferric-dicitrate binding protein FerR (iron transport regulator)
MNDIEDQLGALTRALEDRFPDSSVTPLRLPARDELASRSRWRRRQVRGWLAPLAAAAAVIAVVAGHHPWDGHERADPSFGGGLAVDDPAHAQP